MAVSVVDVPRSAMRQPWFAVPAANNVTSLVMSAVLVPVVVPAANVVVVETTAGLLFHVSVLWVQLAAGSTRLTVYVFALVGAVVRTSVRVAERT